MTASRGCRDVCPRLGWHFKHFYNKFPVECFGGLITLVKVMKIELGGPHELLDRLERTAGPHARRMLERFCSRPKPSSRVRPGLGLFGCQADASPGRRTARGGAEAFKGQHSPSWRIPRISELVRLSLTFQPRFSARRRH